MTPVSKSGEAIRVGQRVTIVGEHDDHGATFTVEKITEGDKLHGTVRRVFDPDRPVEVWAFRCEVGP